MHILVLPERAHWLEQTLASLENEPVNWYLIEGKPGDVGGGRAKGFEYGNAKFVTFVDDDDLVMPGAMYTSVKALKQCKGISQTYSDIEVVDAELNHISYYKFPYSKVGHVTTVNGCWHLHMFRRHQVEEFIPDVAKHPLDEEFLLSGLLCKYGMPKRIPKALYKWRSHDGLRSGKQILDSIRRSTLRKVTKSIMLAKESCDCESKRNL